MHFFIWVDANEKPITKATPYSGGVELCAASETLPRRAFGLRTGTKEELKEKYEIDDSDFNDK
jgi:hypothetical protein